ncbi:hypothetical protein HDZ31DRAFT_33775 [Schizophyllum fasciatum]
MASLPAHVPALVGNLSGSNYTFYGIRMFGRVVIVQADGLSPYAKYHKPNDRGAVSSESTYEDFLVAQRERVDDLDFIASLPLFPFLSQSQIPTIDWQTFSWAYLDRAKRRLIQSHRKMYEIRVPTWTTLVEEEDITLTKIIELYHRQGIWRGMPVEVFRGWSDDSLYHIERGMRAYRELTRRDLDFAHEILGHVIRDGKVVGYITGTIFPSQTGRLVEYCDKKLVYSAVARLHSAGLSYTCFGDSGLMITEGKVKFTNLVGVIATDEKNKELDWESVEELFSPDRRGVPNMFVAPKDADDEFTVLSIVPNPARLYDSKLFSCKELVAPAFQRWQERCYRDEQRRRRCARAMEALQEDWEKDTACSSDSLTRVGTTRANSLLSEAASTTSTIARFHPYNDVMRCRLRVYKDEDEGTAPSNSSATLVSSSRHVSLAPSWD